MAEKKKLMPRELLKQFIKENGLKTVEDAENFVKELFADTIQELLEAEMDEGLGYEKNDARNKETENRLNYALTSAPYGCRQTEIPPKLD